MMRCFENKGVNSVELSLKMDKKFKTLLNALLLYKKVGIIKFRLMKNEIM